MATEKIARQGLTVRHVGVVVTMALTLLTAVGIVFTAAGLCYRPVSQHFGVQTSQVSHTSRSFIWASASALPQWQNCSTSSTLKQYAL